MQNHTNFIEWFARFCEKDMLSTQKRCGWGECFSLYTGSCLLP